MANPFQDAIDRAAGRAPAIDIGPRTSAITQFGRPILRDEATGAPFSERTITVTDDRINEGRPTNIPTVFGGQTLTPEAAIEKIAIEGGRDPETGEVLPSFGSLAEAKEAARARSQSLTVTPQRKPDRGVPPAGEVPGQVIGPDPNRVNPFRAAVEARKAEPLPGATPSADIPQGSLLSAADPGGAGLLEMPKTELQQAAEAGGVDLEEGAPGIARFLSSLGTDQNQAMAGLKEGLRMAFGQEVPLRLGAKTRRLEYLNPITDSWTTVNSPGFSVEDLQSIGGEAIVGGAEVIGGAGGALATGGSPAGALAGASFGAFLGELARLKIGQQYGVNKDASEREIIEQAAKTAGLAAAGGLAGDKLVKVGRAILSGLPSRVSNSPGAQDIRRRLNETALLREQVRQRTGEALPLSAGQLSRDPAILAAERELVGRDVGQPIRELFEQQQRATERFTDMIGDPFVDPRSAEQIGRSIQKSVSAGPEAARRSMERQVRGAEAEALDESQRAISGAQDPAISGAVARQRLAAGKSAIGDQFRQRYADLTRDAGDVRVDLSDFRTTAGRWGDILRNDLIPALSDEDRRIFQQAMTAGTREVQLPGGPALVNEPVSFGQVQRGLSVLRDELRSQRRGVSPRKEVVATQQLHDSLIDARNRAMQGRPDLRRTVDELERDYANFKRDIDRSMIGELLTREEGGGFALRDDQVIGRILSSPSGAREIRQVLSDPRYATSMDAMRPIREGILGEYERRVIDEGTGVANLSKHLTFMRNNSRVLREFFNAAELRRFQAPGGAVRFLKDLQAKEKRVVRAANRAFGTKMDKWDSGDVVNRIFKPESIDSVRRLKSIVGGDMSLWKGFQSAAWRKMMRGMAKFDNASGGMRIDPKQLAKALDKDNEPLLREVFGADTVNDLKTLNSVFQETQLSPAADVDTITQILSDTRPASALRHIARVYFGLFTTEGRLMTAGIRMRTKAAQRVITEALSDPEALADLIQIGRQSPTEKSALRVLGGLGGSVLGVPWTPEEGEADFNKGQPTTQESLDAIDGIR